MSKTDASKWSELFRDWSEMSLLDDIELNTDYYAFSLALWNKLTMQYGGAPEIPIFSFKTFDEDF